MQFNLVLQSKRPHFINIRFGLKVGMVIFYFSLKGFQIQFVLKLV
jgi:hypothetical protein